MLTLPVIRHIRIIHPHYNALRRVQYHFCGVLIKLHNLNLIKETSLNLRTFYKTASQFLQKRQGQERQSKELTQTGRH